MLKLELMNYFMRMRLVISLNQRVIIEYYRSVVWITTLQYYTSIHTSATSTILLFCGLDEWPSSLLLYSKL